MATATKDEIVALEKEYWDAMKCRDGKRSSQLSGKVSLTTGARRHQHSKRQNGQDDGRGRLDARVLQVRRCRSYNASAGRCDYRVQGHAEGDDGRQAARADSSTWIRGADGWECHAHSETILQDGKGA